MSSGVWNETLVEKTVTYTLEMEGRVVIVENVPARVRRGDLNRLDDLSDRVLAGTLTPDDAAATLLKD